MILTGKKIAEEVKIGNIVISPFDEASINPNSYNFTLGKTLKIYKNSILDPRKKNPVDVINIPNDGMVLEPERLYLGHIEETMGSNKYVPIIRGRSSTGRIGLFVHITADLIDIGSINQWTLMLHAVQKVKIYPGMKIGQVTFWQVSGEIELYKGKYQHSTGPMESLSYLDRK